MLTYAIIICVIMLTYLMYQHGQLIDDYNNIANKCNQKILEIKKKCVITPTNQYQTDLNDIIDIQPYNITK